MDFLTVLIVVGLLQYWGSGTPLHRDLWFTRWCVWLGETLPVVPQAVQVVAIATPVLLAAVVWINFHDALWILPLNVLLLVYCLGRGDFSEQVDHYLAAVERDDWEAAYLVANQCQACTLSENDSNWQELHGHMLKALAYNGFERLFAVLFWFLLAGIPGALMYRLSVLWRQGIPTQSRQPEVGSWLWIIEWAPLRVFGLSLALAGHFVACFEYWREVVLDVERGSAEVIQRYIVGALGLQDKGAIDSDRPQAAAGEIRQLRSLYSTTLWIWVCLLALVSILP